MTPPTPNHSSARRWLILLLAACSVLLALYAFRAPILIGIAHAWIISEPVSQADAVVALGGGLQYRTFEAARIYHAGLAPKVLIIQAKLSPTDKLGLTQPERDIFRQVLLKKDVPNDAIIAVGSNCTSTYEDVTAVRDWMLRTGAHSLIAPTDIFHTRRLRWVMRKVFHGTGIQVHITPITPDEYTAEDWWTHEEGLIGFQNEVIKFGFYLLKHRG